MLVVRKHPQPRAFQDEGEVVPNQTRPTASRRVDDFLEQQAESPDTPTVAGALLLLLVDEYRTALNERKWPKCTALGEVMLKAAEQFKEHPDYVQQWEQP
jgi:hypothetical protein